MRSSTHQSRIENQILPARASPHTPPSTSPSTSPSRPSRRPPRPKPPPNLRSSPRTRAPSARIPQPGHIRRLLTRTTPKEPGDPPAPPTPRHPTSRRAPSHSAASRPTTPPRPRRPSGCRSGQAQLLALDCLAAGLLATAVGVGGAAVLGGFLVLDGLEVAGGAGPVFVQEQALVVLCLREDAGPGVEEGRGVCYGLGDGLC